MARTDHRINIDWNRVDKLLKAGCTGYQIAATIGCHHETLYNRCEEEKGTNWSNYSAEKRSNGDALLHESQFDNAVEDRNTSMLIWLGKQRLEQRETPIEITVDKETAKNFTDIMNQLKESQQKAQEALKMAESSIIKEQ